ncbi:hypothetical protein RFI_29813 [Reticulomyxa filosa]|uniref:Mono(ADP-ribosyl)transferase n=1 Tax=Reticulomyxa filosa TaxID=46433 RepID=X6M071_RETFI|nr:hypothetical protein RFI_29813 [Reticulomyxa filosa]|eukprot:ETO07578.1 hypothetical protein RFI_29813 [Reticulomyxa filosa]
MLFCAIWFKYQTIQSMKQKAQMDQRIKAELLYDEDDPLDLVLDETILAILNVHKYMGYPLDLDNICAILLYCARSCNVQFSFDQVKFRHYKWMWMDNLLRKAISHLSLRERREESDIVLYSGLKEVRLDIIDKKIKAGYFISHVSTSDDLQVAEFFRGGKGCILKFHPSMRRATNIESCDISWISPFKNEREILFARSFVNVNAKEQIPESAYAWNARVESENEITQMILLTWTIFDDFVKQTLQISAIWDHSIDLNLIFFGLYHIQGGIDDIVGLLSDFEQWKEQDDNENKYSKVKHRFEQKSML